MNFKITNKVPGQTEVLSQNVGISCSAVKLALPVPPIFCPDAIFCVSIQVPKVGIVVSFQIPECLPIPDFDHPFYPYESTLIKRLKTK